MIAEILKEIYIFRPKNLHPGCEEELEELKLNFIQ